MVGWNNLFFRFPVNLCARLGLGLEKLEALFYQDGFFCLGGFFLFVGSFLKGGLLRGSLVRAWDTFSW